MKSFQDQYTKLAKKSKLADVFTPNSEFFYLYAMALKYLNKQRLSKNPWDAIRSMVRNSTYESESIVDQHSKALMDVLPLS
jgi:hypothetical protein